MCAAEYSLLLQWEAGEGSLGALVEDAVLTRAMDRWKERAKKIQTETYAVYLAYRDPRVPWYARLFAAAIVAYAFSPIDLIPDFIPVLGYLDDLVLVPLGIVLALKMIPPSVMMECRQRAQEVMAQRKPVSRMAAAVIVAIWLLLAALAVVLVVSIWK
jgi:uncharacterized membrane protein YkvA (DUF1232 family)